MEEPSRRGDLGLEIEEQTARRAVNALLKWREKRKGREDEEQGDEDEFMYLTMTLNKNPPKNLTFAPHRIPLRHFLHSGDISICLIVDGKRITAEAAQRIVKSRDIPAVTKILKLSKLKSDYKSFDLKKRLYDSFDMFLATSKGAPLLEKVLGKVFYRKKKKIPVPLDLLPDGSNWREEIEMARRSSLLCLGGGTCSAVRVGRWGVLGGQETLENVLDAIDGVLRIVPKRNGIKCLHLKYSDSLALPIYDSGDRFKS